METWRVAAGVSSAAFLSREASMSDTGFVRIHLMRTAFVASPSMCFMTSRGTAREARTWCLKGERRLWRCAWDALKALSLAVLTALSDPGITVLCSECMDSFIHCLGVLVGVLAEQFDELWVYLLQSVVVRGSVVFLLQVHIVHKILKLFGWKGML